MGILSDMYNQLYTESEVEKTASVEENDELDKLAYLEEAGYVNADTTLEDAVDLLMALDAEIEKEAKMEKLKGLLSKLNPVNVNKAKLISQVRKDFPRGSAAHPGILRYAKAINKVPAAAEAGGAGLGIAGLIAAHKHEKK